MVLPFILLKFEQKLDFIGYNQHIDNLLELLVSLGKNEYLSFFEKKFPFLCRIFNIFYLATSIMLLLWPKSQIYQAKREDSTYSKIDKCGTLLGGGGANLLFTQRLFNTNRTAFNKPW